MVGRATFVVGNAVIDGSALATSPFPFVVGWEAAAGALGSALVAVTFLSVVDSAALVDGGTSV